MKKLYKTTLLIGALALVGVMACEETSTIETPSVSMELLNDGGTVKLTWDEIADVDGYIVEYGEKSDTIEQTYIEISTPVSEIKVYAYKGDQVSNPKTITLAAKETQNIQWYTRQDTDPNHHSGLTILDDGTVVTKSYANDPHNEIDFVADLDNTVSAIQAVDQTISKNNGVGTGSNFDYNTLDIAPSEGYYNYEEAVQGQTYVLRRAQARDWANTDRYAKLIIRSISGTLWTVDVTVQPIGGLRWLVK